ncbi:hypothetical protein NDU88_002367 [Pleurodeles waltl]|uniref:Uncharacterized protein n=1 Tax=Pleurodeles waltl TaxID=8319 RepID=A0AAV7UXE0_PLEWA|nr:hypothetical protein NDU88_002367 [Pleurodeles waltl]
METRFIVVRDYRQYCSLMEEDGRRSDGELGTGTGVGLGPQYVNCIPHKKKGRVNCIPHKKQGKDKTGPSQGSADRYTLRPDNAQWVGGKDSVGPDQMKVKVPVRLVKSQISISSVKALHSKKSSAKIVAVTPPNEKQASLVKKSQRITPSLKTYFKIRSDLSGVSSEGKVKQKEMTECSSKSSNMKAGSTDPEDLVSLMDPPVLTTHNKFARLSVDEIGPVEKSSTQRDSSCGGCRYTE